MTVVWETKRTDPQGATRSITSEITAGGKYITTFTTPDSVGHVYSGADLVFLRDVINEAVDRLEFELSEADLYERARTFDEQQPTRAGKRWSEEEHTQLVGLVNDGVAVGEIATKLDRSPMAIVTRMLMHGIAEVTPVDPDRSKN